MPGRHILVTSASKKIPLLEAVRRAARKVDTEMRVFAGDMDCHALARYVSADFWLMPPAEDAHLAAIIGGCREREIRLVFPTRDGELPFWARHRPVLETAGIPVAVSEPAAVALCLDKLEFARWGRNRGLPFIPAGLHPDEIAAERYAVKERYGAGSEGIGLNLGRGAAISHAGLLRHPIFQPFLAGSEISVDAWLDRGRRVTGVVLRRREVVRDGEAQVTSTFRNPALEQQATQVLEALGVSGPVVLQVLLDAAGEAHIIECNPRIGGASTAGIAAGLEPFYWSIRELEGADPGPFRRIAGEVRQVRVPADLCFYGSDF